MNKNVILMFSVIWANFAFSAITTHFQFDCAEPLMVPVTGAILRYDISWIEGARVATIYSNGVAVVSGEQGEYRWRPSYSGVTEFELKLFKGDGVALASEKVYLVNTNSSCLLIDDTTLTHCDLLPAISFFRDKAVRVAQQTFNLSVNPTDAWVGSDIDVGSGSYLHGSEITLSAVPADGYMFARWDGAISSVQNPITVAADVAKGMKAIFTPLTPEFISVSNAVDGVMLLWSNLAWATQYNIYRASSSTQPCDPLVTLTADDTHCYFDTMGDVGVPYWYWVEAVGTIITNICVDPVLGSKLCKINYEDLHGCTHVNPTAYEVGTSYMFSAPSSRIGYAFMGWTPSSIEQSTKGELTVRASWMANRYEIAYDANGGTGEMAAQSFVYDVGQKLKSCEYVREGYQFAGWSRSQKSAAKWSDGTVVSNLTDVANGRVTLYAAWRPNCYVVSFDKNGGVGTMLDQTFVYGEAMPLAANAFTRTGCTFEGWVTRGSACGTIWGDGAIVSNLTAMSDGSVVLDAQWSFIEYAITYANTKGCSVSNPTAYTIEDEIVFEPLVAPAGWKFLGWLPSKITKGMTGDLTVTALWEQIKYNVDIGGVAENTEQGGCVYGQEVTAKTFAEKTEGYTNIVCKGWIGTGDVPASGTGREVTFTVTQPSTVTWLYQTNYWVSVTASEGGSVTLKDAAGVAVANELWAAAGTNLTAEATADEGWEFSGWGNVDGGTSCGHAGRMTLPVTHPWLIRAEFEKLQYAVTFDLGSHGMRTGGGALVQSVKYGEAAVAPTVKANDGYAFAGWDKAFDSVAGDLVVTAQWEAQGGEEPVTPPAPVAKHTVTFDANGGEAGEASRQVSDGAAVGALPAAARTGYDFAGWFSSAEGGTAFSASSAVSADVTYHAHWTPVAYSISYELDGGENAAANPATYTVEDAVALSDPTRSGYAFAGWSPDGTIAKGSTGDRTFTASWEKSRNEVVEEVVPVEAEDFVAVTYDGYLYGEEDGVVVGTVQVKAAKAKKDKSKLTISVQLAGETKKVSISGDYDLTIAEEQTFTKGGRTIALLLGENGMTGSFEDWLLEGVPNVFALKDADSKAKAEEADSAYVGTYNLIAEEGTFTVTVAKKGKAKVSGKTVAGKSVSVSTQLIVGDGIACVPVMAPKADLAFTVWLGEENVVEGLTDAVIGQAGTLPDGAVFTLDAEALADLVGDDSYADYFPCEVPVTQIKAKWVVAPDEKGKAGKTGKVALKKDGTVDESKLGANPSALKLTYTAKTGAFKGSFKAYVSNRGKPKAVTVSVAGVLVNGVGYGTASVKKYGSVAVFVGVAE